MSYSTRCFKSEMKWGLEARLEPCSPTLCSLQGFPQRHVESAMALLRPVLKTDALKEIRFCFNPNQDTPANLWSTWASKVAPTSLMAGGLEPDDL